MTGHTGPPPGPGGPLDSVWTVLYWAPGRAWPTWIHGPYPDRYEAEAAAILYRKGAAQRGRRERFRVGYVVLVDEGTTDGHRESGTADERVDPGAGWMPDAGDRDHRELT